MSLTVPGVLKAIAAMVAASIIGNWFLTELERSKVNGDAWYKPYLSPPGIIIILFVLILPVLLWMVQN